MTRSRSTRDHVPTPIMAEYYSQRASAGLIIAEATGISREGTGWAFAPGLWNEDQVQGWRVVTDSVHAAGGRIAAQLWHMGRLVHPSFVDGAVPISASATQYHRYAHTYEGKQDYVRARALPVVEIPRVIGDFVEAAGNAMRAGFDCVQLHAANGYLIDQFLRDSTNLRDDEYGGEPKNRIRLLSEVTRAVCGEVGTNRTSVRLSPNGDSQGAQDSMAETLFPLAAEELSRIGIAFLEVREPPPEGTFGKPDRPPIIPAMRRAFGAPFVINSDLDKAAGQAAIDDGLADAVSYGRHFIACPNLPEAMRQDASLPESDASLWYTQGPKGYTDYPPLAIG